VCLAFRRVRLPRTIALALALTLCGVAVPAAGAAPPIDHVWVIVLENKDFDDSFGPDTEAPFLAQELTRRGELLTHYFGTSHASLGNYVTMPSGSAAAPAASTTRGCRRRRVSRSLGKNPALLLLCNS
jgi:phosphatidylinositol-3-phosphatase